MSSSTSAVVAAGHHVGGQWQGECNGHDTTSTLGQKIFRAQSGKQNLEGTGNGTGYCSEDGTKISIQLLVE
jgi:hypothetical protein